MIMETVQVVKNCSCYNISRSEVYSHQIEIGESFHSERKKVLRSKENLMNDIHNMNHNTFSENVERSFWRNLKKLSAFELYSAI